MAATSKIHKRTLSPSQDATVRRQVEATEAPESLANRPREQ
ncbi:MAG: hypothetical protein VBE63_10125 [Lamprobacter sp.]|nr:hypothetical protein [Lamprobacter sp.]MEA3640288.1 hypothetical protein [Lamprobacter sp.]